VRVALQNQRDDLLAFAGVLNAKLAAIAQAHAIAEPLVREACVLYRPSTPRPHTGRGGTDDARRRGAGSTPCSPP